MTGTNINETSKQFIDQLPDGFKLSWKLFKDLKK